MAAWFPWWLSGRVTSSLSGLDRSALPMARTFDDVPDLLTVLRDAGIATALVTNSSVKGVTNPN